MLNKMFKGVLDVIAPVVELIVTQAVKLAFEEFYKNNPDDAELTVVSLYPVIDTKLEPLAEKTDTKLDDAGVRGLKQGIEAFAGGHGIELPNLDND
jgi:hypothetical protein